NRRLSGDDFGDAVETEVTNAVCELGTSIEERSKFIDVGLILPGSRACPKPVAVQASDAVWRIVATGDSYDKDIAICPDRHFVGGKVRYTRLKSPACHLL